MQLPPTIANSHSDEVQKTFTISSNSDFMSRFEKFLAYIQHCGNIGHSCVVGLSVDGDGSERPKIKEQLPKIKDAITKRDSFEIPK